MKNNYISQGVRRGLAGVVLSSIGVLGLVADAGPANALTIGPSHPILPVSCGSTVAIGAPVVSEKVVTIGTAPPGGLADNVEVIDLTVTGCTTSADPVVVEALGGDSFVGSASVTPSSFLPRDYLFSATVQLPDEYTPVNQCGADPVTLSIIAVQPAARVTSNTESYTADTEFNEDCLK